MQVKAGSWWVGTNCKKFVVISVTKIDEHTWVHYRDDSRTGEPREYSCYEESFIQRFSLFLNEQR